VEKFFPQPFTSRGSGRTSSFRNPDFSIFKTCSLSFAGCPQLTGTGASFGLALIASTCQPPAFFHAKEDFKVENAVCLGFIDFFNILLSVDVLVSKVFFSSQFFNFQWPVTFFTRLLEFPMLPDLYPPVFFALDTCCFSEPSLFTSIIRSEVWRDKLYSYM